MRSLAWFEVGNHLSLRIIRAAQEIYHCLGPGHSEDYYRKAVVNRLEREKLDVQRRFPVDVWQSGELVDLFFLDLFVELQVVVSVQVSRRPLREADRREAMSQIQAVGAPIGILLNFGRPQLEYQRVFP